MHTPKSCRWLALLGRMTLLLAMPAAVVIAADGLHGGGNSATDWQLLHINEVLPWNVTGIPDEDGDPADWIEIYNSGTNAVNLDGIGLSDDDDEPFLWRFPDRVIAPRGFLLVYASAKNRTTPRLHTNFTLDAQG